MCVCPCAYVCGSVHAKPKEKCLLARASVQPPRQEDLLAGFGNLRGEMVCVYISSVQDLCERSLFQQ